MGAGTRVRQWAERFGEGQLVTSERRTECPEGLKLECKVISKRKSRQEIDIPKQELMSYLGNEPSWIKIEIEDKTLVKKHYLYGVHKFYIPKGIDLGKKAEVTVNKITLAEFVRIAVEKTKGPYTIEANRSGNYELVIGNARIPLILVEVPESAGGLHFEKGEINKPTVIFAVDDFQGKKHGIKIAYGGSGESFVGFKLRIDKAIESNDIRGIVRGYRPIVDMRYGPDMGLLEIKYHEKRSPSQRPESWSAVWLRPPEFEKLMDLEIWFDAKSLSKPAVEGVVNGERYTKIDWDPDKDQIEKGKFGTVVEYGVLNKLGIEHVTYDTTGQNSVKRGGILCFFDVTYFNENGEFAAEEVKLITNEKERDNKLEEATEQLVRRMYKWNAIPDEDRKGLPKVYEGRVVIIKFDPQTREFTREIEEQIHIDRKTGQPVHIDKGTNRILEKGGA